MDGIDVLIVEDNRLVARDIQELLTSNGFTVSDIVATGKDALSSVQKWRPDAVLMDIQLKGHLNGITTAKMIRENYDIPIIFLTAYSDKKTIQHAKESEPYAFLIKPFNERELFSAVEIAVYKNNLERQLKENKLWFSNTLNSLGEGVIATDNDFIIQFINPAAESLTGYEITDAFQKKLFEVVKFQELLDNEPVPIYGQDLLEAISGRFTREYFLLRNDGSTIPVNCSISQIQDTNGVQHGMVLVFRDISQQIRSSQQLEQLKRAIEQSSECIFITNRAGSIEFANPAFNELTMNGHNEIAGEDFAIVLSGHNKDLEKTFRKIRIDVLNGIDRTETFSFSRENRAKIDIWALFSPVKDQRGKVINIVCIARDLTVRKRLEALGEAVNIMENIGYVFSGIRHEIGNPVNTVKMILSLIQEEDTVIENQKMSQKIDAAIHEIRRVEELLLSLKSFNMYEQTTLERIELKEFLERFVALIKPDIHNRTISFDYTIEHDELCCYADSRALHQVLLNLVTNAMDAVEDISDPQIKVSVSTINGNVLLDVIDNGIGINEEIERHLFKPFYTNKKEGTGLGLVITKKLITNMNGTINHRRNMEAGETIFTVSLPRSFQDEK